MDTQPSKKTKFIFITGGVLSSLGKGLAAASIGALLESRGMTITFQKLDPYINVDPGTMNPFQHGEVLRYYRLGLLKALPKIGNARVLLFNKTENFQSERMPAHFQSLTVTFNQGIRTTEAIRHAH